MVKCEDYFMRAMNTNTYFQKNDFFFGSKERRLAYMSVESKDNTESQDAQKKLKEKIQRLSTEEREKLEADLQYLADTPDTNATTRESERKPRTENILRLLGYTSGNDNKKIRNFYSELTSYTPTFIEINVQPSAARELLQKIQVNPKEQRSKLISEVSQKQKLKKLKAQIPVKETRGKFTNTSPEKEKKMTNAELLQKVLQDMGEGKKELFLPVSSSLKYGELAETLRLYTQKAKNTHEFDNVESIRNISIVDVLPKTIAQIILQKGNTSENGSISRNEIFVGTPLGEFAVQAALQRAKNDRFSRNRVAAAKKYLPRIIDSIMFTAQKALQEIENTDPVLNYVASTLDKTDKEGFADFKYIRHIGTGNSNLYELGNTPEKYITAKYIENNKNSSFEIQTNTENIRVSPETLRTLLDGKMVYYKNNSQALIQNGDGILLLPVKKEALHDGVVGKNKKRHIALSGQYDMLNVEGDYNFLDDNTEHLPDSRDQMKDIANITEILASTGKGLAVTPEGKIFVEYDPLLDTEVFGRLNESPYSRMAKYYQEKAKQNPNNADEMKKMQSLMISYDYITKRDGNAEIGDDYTKKGAMFPVFQKIFSKEAPLRFDEIMTQEKEEHNIPVGEMEMLGIFQNLVLTGKLDLQNPEAVRTFWENVERQGRMVLQSEDAMKEALQQKLTGDILEKYMQEFKEKFDKPFFESEDDFVSKNAVAAGMYLAKKIGLSLPTTPDASTVLAKTILTRNPKAQEKIDTLVSTQTQEIIDKAKKECAASIALLQTLQNADGEPLVRMDNSVQLSFGAMFTHKEHNWKPDVTQKKPWKEIERNTEKGDFYDVKSSFRNLLRNTVIHDPKTIITNVEVRRVEGPKSVVESHREDLGTTSITSTETIRNNAIADTVTYENPTRYTVIVETTNIGTTTNTREQQQVETIKVPVTITTTSSGEKIIQVDKNYVVIEDTEQERKITTVIKEARDVKIKKMVQKKREANREISFEALANMIAGENYSVDTGIGGKAFFDGSHYEKGFLDFVVKANRVVALSKTTSLNAFLASGINILGEGKNTASVGITGNKKTEHGTWSVGANTGVLMTDFFKNLVPKYSATAGYQEDYQEKEKWADGVFGNFGIKNPKEFFSATFGQKKNPAELSKKIDEAYRNFKEEMNDPQKKEIFIAYLENVVFPGEHITDEQATMIHDDLFPVYMEDDIGRALFGEILERGLTLGVNGADSFIALSAGFIISAKQQLLSQEETSNPVSQYIESILFTNTGGETMRNMKSFPLEAYETTEKEQGWKTYSALPQGKEFEILTQNIPGGYAKNLSEIRLFVHEDVDTLVQFHEDGTFSVANGMPLEIYTVVKSGDVRIIETHIGNPQTEIVNQAFFSPSKDLASPHSLRLQRVGLQKQDAEEKNKEIREKVQEAILQEQRLEIGFENALESTNIQLQEDLEPFEKLYFDSYRAVHTIRKSIFQNQNEVQPANRLTWEQEQDKNTMDMILANYLKTKTDTPLHNIVQEYKEKGLSSEGIAGEILKRITALRSKKDPWEVAERNRKKAIFTEATEKSIPLFSVVKADLARIMGINPTELDYIHMGCGGENDQADCQFTEKTTQNDAETILTEYGAKGILSLTNYDRKNNFVGINRIRTTHVEMYAPQKYTYTKPNGEQWVIYTGYYKECHNPLVFAYKKPNAKLMSSSTEKHITQGAKIKNIGASLGVLFTPKYGEQVVVSHEEREREETRRESRTVSKEVGEFTDISFTKEDFTKEEVKEFAEYLTRTIKLPPTVTTTTNMLTILQGVWSQGGSKAFNTLSPETQQEMLQKYPEALAKIGENILGIEHTTAWNFGDNFPSDIRDVAAANSSVYNGNTEYKQRLYDWLTTSYPEINDFTPPTETMQFQP